jgi:serine/threonine protein phosphatase PrpC
MTRRSGAASDSGRIRELNEDRSFADDDRGIYLVVDGVGGHAGGDRAAEIALEVIAAELGDGPDDELRIRRAITAANNEICRKAASDETLRGMGCVLTLAVLREGRMTFGHVGDSRLYLIWNGGLRKLTSDHSPVGEREDRGELSEEEAMLHPRRHEVFRDVGSRLRDMSEADFIEVREFAFKPDAAVLLCSDGLTDMLTSPEILAIVERYDGDAQETARRLVEAANEAGGLDNVTAVFVAGPEFLGAGSSAMQDARTRHQVTRQRRLRFSRWFTGRGAFLVYGFALGILIGFCAWKFALAR